LNDLSLAFGQIIQIKNWHRSL